MSKGTRCPAKGQGQTMILLCDGIVRWLTMTGVVVQSRQHLPKQRICCFIGASVTSTACTWIQSV